MADTPQKKKIDPPRPLPLDEPPDPSLSSSGILGNSVFSDDNVGPKSLIPQVEDEPPPSMAATSQLKTFAEKMKEDAKAKEQEEETKEAVKEAAREGAREGAKAAAQAADEEASGNEGAISTTIHSGSDSVNDLDLTPPGSSPETAPQGTFHRGMSAFFGGIARLWRRIPPLEDIFDMILASLGFQRKPASMLRRAQNLAAKGRYADAIKWYRDILFLRPLTISAYDGLGRVYFRMGLTEEANREFTIADSLERLVNNRDDLEAANALAQALVSKKQAKMAASLLEPVLIAHFYSPNNSNLLKGMGEVYAELRATKKMLQVYEAGLLQHPDDHEFYILKGNLDVKLGKVPAGEKLIRWGRLMGRLKENSQDINANMAMGELCIKEGKMEDGLGYLRTAATLSPENSGIRWRLFNLYQKQGNYPEALRYFQEVLAIEPDNEELQYKLGDFYRRNHHYEEAFQIYKKLTLKHPRDPRPMGLMAGVLTDLGQTDEATKAQDLANTLAIGLMEDPDHREVVTFMKYLFSIGENKEATEWLDRGLAHWPYHGELIITKAKILYNEYRYKEAVSLLKRLISVKHDIAEPHMWLALCYQRMSNNMAALAEAQLATRLAPKSYTAHKVLGDILKEQKKLSQANAAYEVADMIRLSQQGKGPKR
ncbi:MAG: tetratricopeptide repeat protein [Deltaproteobacteria bacterium]|jgi:tetratricopeptide (TPR) repeat protein|nr:tetratricopeptide repeat protein [Deltaproteobacteria bacterium]